MLSPCQLQSIIKTCLRHSNNTMAYYSPSKTFLDPSIVRCRASLRLQHRNMAGHNKWSKIKHKKGAKDLNRGREIAKATRAIRAASRACGGDTDNLHLQSTIQSAKAIQVPKDRIMDAIAGASTKGRGSSGEDDFSIMRYDGRLTTPSSKVAIIVMALTDNRNRTAAHVRSIFSKAGGEMLNSGANEWLFDHVGVVLVYKKKSGKDCEEGRGDNDMQVTMISPFEGISEEEEEELLECSLEGGAIDVDFGENKDELALIKCEIVDLHNLVLALRQDGYKVSEFESRYLVKDDGTGGTSSVILDTESMDSLDLLLDKLNDDEDVSSAYHNAILFDQIDY